MRWLQDKVLTPNIARGKGHGGDKRAQPAGPPDCGGERYRGGRWFPHPSQWGQEMPPAQAKPPGLASLETRVADNRQQSWGLISPPTLRFARGDKGHPSKARAVTR